MWASFEANNFSFCKQPTGVPYISFKNSLMISLAAALAVKHCGWLLLKSVKLLKEVSETSSTEFREDDIATEEMHRGSIAK